MTTTLQKLAGVFGVVFILIAVLGFISPGGLVMTMEPTTTSAVTTSTVARFC